ncbi:MAG: hypothetical protein IIY89_07080 [Clostridia bacterium]|nr:hypothetical protein [Clostridia bacterium]
MMILSVVPVVSSLLFGVEEASVSGIVSQSRISLRSGRIRTVTVTDPATGEKEVMSERDYLCGIVASQMPMEYDDEAIKAQAVASYTLMRYRRIFGTPADAQSFLSKKQLRQQWGRGIQPEPIQAQIPGEFGLWRIHRLQGGTDTRRVS